MVNKVTVILFLFAHFGCYGQGSADFENVLLPIPKKARYRYAQVEPSIYINPKKTFTALMPVRTFSKTTVIF